MDQMRAKYWVVALLRQDVPCLLRHVVGFHGRPSLMWIMQVGVWATESRSHSEV